MLDLRERRKALGLTLKQVAAEIGVSESCVSRYESGEIKNMRRNIIERYATVLRIDPIEFIKLGVVNCTDVEDAVTSQIVTELKTMSPELRREVLDFIKFKKSIKKEKPSRICERAKEEKQEGT